MRGRLVGDQRGRLLREGDRDLDALQLAAARASSGARSANAVDAGALHRARRPRRGRARVGRAQRPEMRGAADRHRLAHADAGGHAGALRDEGAQPGELAAAQRRARPRRPSATVPPLERLQPGRGAHERRLAGAVGPDDGDELARRAPCRSRAVQDLGRRRAGRSATSRASSSGRITLPCAAARGTAGTPRTTMNGPTGSSIGASTVRASVSPASSSAAPASAVARDHEARARDVPPASRTRCGTTRPRKPSRPASAAAAEASSAAAIAGREPDALRARAERLGDVVAEREPVQRPDQHGGEQEADGEVGPGDVASPTSRRRSGRRRSRRRADCTRSE